MNLFRSDSDTAHRQDADAAVRSPERRRRANLTFTALTFLIGTLLGIVSVLAVWGVPLAAVTLAAILIFGVVGPWRRATGLTSGTVVSLAIAAAVAAAFVVALPLRGACDTGSSPYFCELIMPMPGLLHLIGAIALLANAVLWGGILYRDLQFGTAGRVPRPDSSLTTGPVDHSAES